MSTPLLYLLPIAARKAYPYILAGVRQGLSSRTITSNVQAAGIPISRSRSVLPVMRELQKQEKYSTTLKNIGKNRTINTSRLPEAITMLRRQYSYQVRITGTDMNGETVERHVTVATDSPTMTPGMIESTALDVVLGNSIGYGLEDAEATLVGGLQRATTNLF